MFCSVRRLIFREFRMPDEILKVTVKTRFLLLEWRVSYIKGIQSENVIASSNILPPIIRK